MCSAEADLGLPYLSSATFDVGTAVPSFADSYGGTWWHLGFSHYIHMLYYVISYMINYIYTPTLSWRSLALQSDGPGPFPGFIKLRLNLDLDSRWSSNKNW